MAEILSQKEIDALLNNISEEKKEDDITKKEEKADDGDSIAPESDKNIKDTFSPELKKRMDDLNIGKIPTDSKKAEEISWPKGYKNFSDKAEITNDPVKADETPDVGKEDDGFQDNNKKILGFSNPNTSKESVFSEKLPPSEKTKIKGDRFSVGFGTESKRVEGRADVRKTSPERAEHTREERLNAAEIFCKYNPFGYKTEEEKTLAQEKALQLLEKEHSPEEIDAAIRVAEARNGMRGLTARFKDIEEQYKNAIDNPKSNEGEVKAKRDQQIEKLREDKKIYENKIDDLLRDLKVENLKTKLKDIEEFRDHADFPEKVQNAEKSALSMMCTEMERWQNAQMDVNRMVNPKGWDHVSNFFSRTGEKMAQSKLVGGYFRMNRNKRTALTAAIIGAGTALAIPSVIAAGAGVGMYLGKKMLDALVGGNVGYFISKKIIQPIGEKAFKHDVKKTTEELQTEALADTRVQNLEAIARGTFEGDAEKALRDIANANIGLGSKYATEMRRHTKYRSANRFLGALAAGLVAGKGTVMATEYLLGPSVFNVFGVKESGSTEFIPEQKGGVAPIPEGPKGASPEVGISPETLKIGTVGQGEGVEHVLRRQLELDPEKFGFKGDISDKMAIRTWSGGEAHRIAIDQGYIDKMTGEEIRVRDIGPKGADGNPAYILEQGAGGKPTVHEYLDGKPSGGEGMKNAYEYLYDKPKISADAQTEVPVEADNATKLETVLSDQYADRINAPAEPLPYEVPTTKVPDHLEIPPSVQRVNIFESFEKTVPEMEQMTQKFPKLSLHEQAEYLDGPQINNIEDQITYLKNNNLDAATSAHETELFSKIKGNYVKMLETYQENEASFEASVKGTVQLNNAGLDKLLNTKIDKIWDVYKGPQDGRILDFVKSINPNSQELASSASVGDVLRSRFVEGTFLKTPKASL